MKKTRTTISLKLNRVLTKTESVKSGSNGSRASSPPPKKNKNCEKKEVKKTEEDKKKEVNTLGDNKKEASMEHSGGPNERKGDQKVDFSNQCNINETEELKEVKLNLLLVREELVQLKKEKILLKAHNVRKHAGYEAELNDILVEKQRFSVEMVKLQSDRDLLLAKVTALEQNNAVDKVDECIEDVACQGNCEHVGCGISQLQRLNNMKNQGGRRESPVEGTANTNCF